MIPDLLHGLLGVMLIIKDGGILPFLEQNLHQVLVEVVMEEVSVLVVEDVVEVVHGHLHGILDHGLVLMTAMHPIQTIQMDGLVVVKE
tara:strand:- start:9 stop:272 length:264 start_codon:yes stop_codon:yes gene_type:complete